MSDELDSKDRQPEAPVISERLLELLVCPVDKQPLKLEQSTLICTACQREYPVVQGIPQMLVDRD
jgi:uncharacterized protein YbaR (Trm112 family)